MSLIINTRFVCPAQHWVEGNDGDGKSVFLNIVSSIMDDYATTAPMDTFTASLGDLELGLGRSQSLVLLYRGA